MRKVLSVATAALIMGGTLVATAPSAEARPGWRGGYHGGGYAYRGYHRGNRAGAAVAAGIAGLALGALATQAYRNDYYGRPAYPAYGPPPPGYYYGY